MPLPLKTREQQFQARLDAIAVKSYVDLEGASTPYLQAGHLSALENVKILTDLHERLTAANRILTTAEERAGVIAKLRELNNNERETFKLPEAGSAGELDSLQVLSGRLHNVARTRALQTAQASCTAHQRGASETMEIGSPV